MHERMQQLVVDLMTKFIDSKHKVTKMTVNELMEFDSTLSIQMKSLPEIGSKAEEYVNKLDGLMRKKFLM